MRPFYKQNIPRILLAILLSFLSLFVGVTGYSIIEGYDLIDAFYMSVITISTVGYTEVKPLSDAGKIFSTIYIIFNFIRFRLYIVGNINLHL